MVCSSLCQANRLLFENLTKRIAPHGARVARVAADRFALVLGEWRAKQDVIASSFARRAARNAPHCQALFRRLRCNISEFCNKPVGPSAAMQNVTALAVSRYGACAKIQALQNVIAHGNCAVLQTTCDAKRCKTSSPEGIKLYASLGVLGGSLRWQVPLNRP
jgi:hypothetical protein